MSRGLFLVGLLACAGPAFAADAEPARPTVNHRLKRRAQPAPEKPAEPAEEPEPQAKDELTQTNERLDAPRSPAPGIEPSVPKTFPSPCALDMRCRTDAGAAKAQLGVLRSALALYYGDKEGEYPATLAALIPKYLSYFPAISSPGHPKSNKITVVTSAKGYSAGPYVKDTGGWLYFRVPGNEKLDGTVVIDCLHADEKGKALWTY